MTTPPASVPAWPRYRLTAAADGTVTVTGPAAPSTPYADRAQAVEAVAELAGRLTPPRAVRAEAADTDGTVWPLLIEPDGTVTEAGPAQRTKPPKRRKKAKEEAPTAVPAPPPHRDQPDLTGAPTVQLPAQAPAPLPQSAPFTIPTLPAADQPTARVRAERPTAPADEPTVAVRPRVRPVAEQHERAADAPGLRPVAPAPAPQPAPAPASDPRRATPAPTGPQPIPSFLRIRALEQAGQLDDAARMAAALDDAATRSHGPSHRTALQAREVRAHLAALQGNLPAAVALYRDVAERWHLQGDAAAAEQTAGRAHALWLKMSDPAQAIPAGEIVVRLRSTIPGEAQMAYRQAVKHLADLRHTAQPGTPR
ncbi:hypothetical protein [Streptomyces pseudovenezuelae]|uniref:hypothetical protein n=1 Tax=Streptomyces pseudovenezuelae TaxID=67350 RepID=UPI0036E4696E